MSQLVLIAAVGENLELGEQGKLPWSLPADLRRFRDLTYGYPVLMGRATFESLGAPLEGRPNLVLTRQLPSRKVRVTGVEYHTNLRSLLTRGAELNSEQVFVIGGQQLFEQTLPLASTVHLTEIHASFPQADRFFPALSLYEWEQTFSLERPADREHLHNLTFSTYTRH